MKQRIYDAGGGVVSTVMTNDLDKTTTFAQHQDVEAIIENNKRLQTENDGYNPTKDMRRVASIPTTVLQNWLKEAGIPARTYMQNPRHYAKWLRSKIYDKDNEAWLTAPHLRNRTKPGIVGLDSVISEGRK